MEEDRDQRPDGPALKGVQPSLPGGRHVSKCTSTCSDESQQRRHMDGQRSIKKGFWGLPCWSSS